MTIEINELVIRAEIQDSPSGGREQRAAPRDDDGEEREAIVQACVKEVLRILRRREER